MAVLRCVVLVRLVVGQILTTGISSRIFTGLLRCYCASLGMRRLISGMSDYIDMRSLPTRTSGRDSDKKRSDGHRIAEMIAVMGPPPKEMIQNSVYATEFLDDEGSWKKAIEIPLMSLETLEGNLEGEPRLLFFQFPRKMLKWKPEGRLSSRELLEDPWLRSP